MSINKLLAETVNASQELWALQDETINKVLHEVAAGLMDNLTHILAENERDLLRMDKSDPKYDRLQLSAERIEGIANDIITVSKLPSPLGKTLSKVIRPNGIRIHKMSVPFGVIGIIYEARPNVTCDVFALCLKSGNACVLKGGSDADYSNRALVAIIHEVLKRNHIDPAVCTLLPPDREATAVLLNAVGLVDLIIPRGSKALINYVRDHARIPVIETGRSEERRVGNECPSRCISRRCTSPLQTQCV